MKESTISRLNIPPLQDYCMSSCNFIKNYSMCSETSVKTSNFIFLLLLALIYFLISVNFSEISSSSSSCSGVSILFSITMSVYLLLLHQKIFVISLWKPSNFSIKFSLPSYCSSSLTCGYPSKYLTSTDCVLTISHIPPLCRLSSFQNYFSMLEARLITESNSLFWNCISVSEDGLVEEWCFTLRITFLHLEMDWLQSVMEVNGWR